MFQNDATVSRGPHGVADDADPVVASKAGDTVPFEFIADVSHYLQIRTVTRNSADTNSHSPLVISDHSHSSLLQPASFDGSTVDDVCLSFVHRKS